MQTFSQCGKLEQVMKETIKYKIDVLGLCEMRWAHSGSMKEEETTRVCSKHLEKACLNHHNSVIQIHAPTMEGDDKNIDNYYQNTIEEIL